MDTAAQIQILDETDCISHSTSTLRKGMNAIIFSPSMSKLYDKLGSSASVRQPVEEKENSEFKPAKLCKNGPCVTSCQCGGVGKYIDVCIKHTHTHTHNLNLNTRI